MRKSVLLLASVATAVLLACGVALAAEISCPTGPNGLCVGTGQSDTMTGTDTRDDMRGGGGNDRMNSLAGNDRLSGELGDDILSGQKGNDTYVLGDLAGSDRIAEGGESGGIDTIDFSAESDRTRADLGDSSFASANGSNFEFPSTAIIEDFRAGTGDDEIWGNRARNHLYGNAGNDRLHGRVGSDYLSGGPSSLSGFGSRDVLFGDAGNDKLDGGSGGGDSYEFQLDSWGNDTIIDATPSNQNSPQNLVRFGRDLTQALTINLVSSPDAPEVLNANGTGRVNWSGNAINSVSDFSPTDDQIVGNPAANRIFIFNYPYGFNSGSDIVSTGEGDDTIYVLDGFGDDEVDCGEDGPGITDNDTVYADTGDTVTNCETLRGYP